MIVDKRLSYARQLSSPNCSERPLGVEIELLVIHNISLPPGRYGQGHIEALFSNQLDCAADPYFEEIAHLQVSAHLLIDRLGEVTQFVPFDRKAWHAGRSEFDGREQCNDFSIGIELEGTDTEAFTSVQYERLIQISRELMAQYPLITLERIVGHSDIAPGRKSDPGPYFDWARFRAACA